MKDKQKDYAIDIHKIEEGGKVYYTTPTIYPAEQLLTSSKEAEKFSEE